MRSILFDTLFWLAAISAIGAQLVIIWSVRPRRRRGVGDFIWAVVPALGLVGVLVLTWRAIHPVAG